MDNPFLSSRPIKRLPLWKKAERRRRPLYFELEITARCNNNCRHCCINIPAGDRKAMSAELSLNEIKKLADEAVSMGALWCLITGGEPLLRKDFPDIYSYLKKKGLVISVFTNAALVGEEHVRLFRKYPPGEVEITVYGITPGTYEAVTRNPGSFRAFRRGLGLLMKNSIRVNLKTIAMRSNLAELPEISRFCRERTGDYFRIDPFLHMRFDGDPERNREIASERLNAGEIAILEKSDVRRFRALKKECGKSINERAAPKNRENIFLCGAGNGGFTVSPTGLFRLCSSLWHPACVYDLRKGDLREAYDDLVPRARAAHSSDAEFIKNCGACPITNICNWCPGHSHLETGRIDAFVDYFCEVAHARASSLLTSSPSIKAP